MNTEPPEGDELQRMLVAMKQTVLERATPRPKRHRRRTGVVVGVVALLALGTATGAVALTLSQQDRPVAAPVQTQEPVPAPTATTPTSAPITATPVPLPTPGPTSLPTAPAGQRVPIPAPCSSLVPQDDYFRFFGAARLIETVFEDGVPRDTTPEDRLHGLTSPDGSLSCWWQNEGTAAALSLDIHRTSADEQVVATGGTCSDRLGGRVCTSTITDEMSTVPQTATTLYRDGITVAIGQTDFPTNGLLDAVVGEIWGD